MIRVLILLLCMVTATVSSARDLGFRYADGKCLNASGESGLNPSFIGPCADLRHVTLENLDLSEIDFSGSHFEFSDLQGTRFTRSIFNGVSFASANLAGADFTNTKFDRTDFTAATLVNVHFGGAEVLSSNFSQSDLSGVLLSYTSFQKCVFTDALLQGAVLDHADFSGADLRNMDLNGADLRGALLNGADISGTDFSGANLNGAQLNGAFGDRAKFRAAVLRQAQIVQASFVGASFRGAQMEGVVLSQSDLSSSDLRGAKLSQAQVINVNFNKAKFSQSTVLPFSSDEALQKGMLLSQSNVLILWDERGPDIDGLVQFLESQGLNVKLSNQDATQFDGSERLTGITSILHLLGSSRVIQRNVPAGGQDALLGFVQRGGTYVATQWLGFMSARDHLVRRMQDLVLIGVSTLNVSSVQFNTVADKSNHPVLSGIPSQFTLEGGIGSGSLSSFDRQPAISLMKSPKGDDMVAAREYGLGKVVNFSFAGSFDLDNSSSHILNSPVVRQLILNALEW